MPTIPASFFEDEAPTQAPAGGSALDFVRQNHYSLNSGYRTPQHNAEVGGVPNSYHTRGDAGHPGAVDIAPTGVDKSKLIAQAGQYGGVVIDETNKPGAAHYHIQFPNGYGKGGKKAQAQPAKPKELGSPTGNAPMPIITDANGNQVLNPAFQQQQTTASKPTPIINRSVPDNLPTVSASNFEPDENAKIQAIVDSYKPKPQPQAAAQPQVKADPGFLQNLWTGAQAMGQEISNGYHAQAVNRARPYTGVGDFLQRELFTQNPLVQGGAGALSEAANFVNGASTLVGGPRIIPTGDLDRFTAEAPLYSSIGRALPYMLGEGALAKAGEKVAPALMKSATATPLRRIGAGTAVQAAEGFINDPGEAGMQGRVNNALVSGGLGAALHAGGEVLHGKGKAPENHITEAPKPATKELPQHIETVGPGHLNPVQSTAQPKELTAAFAQRGGVLPSKPKGNLDAQILGPDGRPAPAAKTDKLPSAFEAALNRTREVGQPEPTPAIETAKGGAPARRDVALGAEPNIINPITGKPYEGAATVAKDSAKVLEAHENDVRTAKTLHQEALADVQNHVEAVRSLAGVDDVTEAQRTVSSRIRELESKAQAGQLPHDEAAVLQEHRTAYDGLLQAQRQFNEAEALLKETKTPASRSTIEAPPETAKPPAAREIATSPQHSDLPSTVDLAMRRADALEQTTREIGSVNATESKRPADNNANDLRGTPATKAGPSLLDSSGRPMQRELSDPIIERHGQPKPGNPGDLTLPESYKPQPTEVGKIERKAATETKAGQEAPTEQSKVFTPQGTAPEQASQLKAELQKRILDNGGQLLSVAEAKRFHAASGRPGGEHLDTYLDAATRGEDATIKYTPLKNGRKTTESRTISPFGIEKRAIEPATELANLRRQHGTDDAVRSHLIEVARSKGKTVGAGEITTKPASMKAAIERLGLNEHIYLHSHNFGETTVSTGKSERGYRLDTITESSLTGQKSKIPTSAQYQNEISAGFNALHELAAHPDATPAFKRAVRQIQKGRISRQSVRELKESLSKSAEAAAKFCQAVGIPK